jgi:hypothetical protein
VSTPLCDGFKIAGTPYQRRRQSHWLGSRSLQAIWANTASVQVLASLLGFVFVFIQNAGFISLIESSEFFGTSGPRAAAGADGEQYDHGDEPCTYSSCFTPTEYDPLR